MPKETPKTKPKPWGREIWWADTPKYAGKILEVKAGKRLSLQYHRWKMETMYIYAGEVEVTYGDDVKKLKKKILKPGDVWHNPPRLIHRLTGVAKLSVIFEVSTPHLQDVIRLQDDFDRKKSGNDEAADRRLAKK